MEAVAGPGSGSALPRMQIHIIVLDEEKGNLEVTTGRSGFVNQ